MITVWDQWSHGQHFFLTFTISMNTKEHEVRNPSDWATAAQRFWNILQYKISSMCFTNKSRLADFQNVLKEHFDDMLYCTFQSRTSVCYKHNRLAKLCKGDHIPAHAQWYLLYKDLLARDWTCNRNHQSFELFLNKLTWPQSLWWRNMSAGSAVMCF